MKKLFIVVISLLSMTISAQVYRMSSTDREQIAKVSKKTLVFFMRIEEVLDINKEKLLIKKTDIQNPAVKEVVKQGVKHLGDENQYKLRKMICITCYEEEWNKQMIEMELIKQGQTYDRDKLYGVETHQVNVESPIVKNSEQVE